MFRRLLKQEKNGFTMMEVIIALAIIVILGAAVIIRLPQIRSSLKHKEMDSIAETVYTAAQNRLSELRASGRETEYRKSGNTPVPASGLEAWSEGFIPADAAGENDGYTAGEMCFLIWSKEDALSQTLLPNGHIDPETAGGSIVIEFNFVSGSVYSVWFMEEEGALDYYSPEDYNAFRVFDTRRETEPAIGYYGKGTAEVKNRDTVVLNPKVTLENAERLIAHISCPRPNKITDSQIMFNVRIYRLDEDGKRISRTDENGNKVYETADGQPTVISVEDGIAAAYDPDSKSFAADFILDSLKEDENSFRDFVLYCPTFTPGSDIEVEVTAKSAGDSTYYSTRDSESCNSLFADESEGSNAVIKYGRHLQNLHPVVSGVEGITTAELGADIAFGADSPWQETYGERVFKPVNNQLLDKLYGSDHSINDIKAESANGEAGVFGAFYGTEISKLTMNSPDIHGAGSSGAVAGITVNAAGAVLSECAINNATIKSDLGAAGGLIGKANTAVTVSKAEIGIAEIVSNESAGGIIGETGNTARVSEAEVTGAEIKSDASAGGIIGKADNTAIVSEAKVTDADIDSSASAGGIIGKADNTVNVSKAAVTNADIDSYASAGGVLGEGDSTVTVSVAEVINAEIDCAAAAGGIVGRSAGSVSVTEAKVYQLPGDSGYDNDDGVYGIISGGIIGEISEDITSSINNSFAATVIGTIDTEAAGGLVGEYNGLLLTVKGSYADNYIYGKNTAGLVGDAAAGLIHVYGSYSAGFLYGSAAQAGMIYNSSLLPPRVVGSYTVDMFCDDSADEDTKFYSIARNLSADSDAAYYAKQGADSDEGIIIDESLVAGIADFCAQLNDSLTDNSISVDTEFTYETADALRTGELKTTPYNLEDNELEPPYPFPLLALEKDGESAGLRHFNDWDDLLELKFQAKVTVVNSEKLTAYFRCKAPASYTGDVVLEYTVTQLNGYQGGPVVTTAETKTVELTLSDAANNVYTGEFVLDSLIPGSQFKDNFGIKPGSFIEVKVVDVNPDYRSHVIENVDEEYLDEDENEDSYAVECNSLFGDSFDTQTGSFELAAMRHLQNLNKNNKPTDASICSNAADFVTSAYLSGDLDQQNAEFVGFYGSDYSFTPIRNDDFTTLYGQECSVSNLYVSLDNDANAGLFGTINNGQDNTISELTLINPNVSTAGGYAGAFAAYTTSPLTIEECYVIDGNVVSGSSNEARAAGGFVGYNYKGHLIIENSGIYCDEHLPEIDENGTADAYRIKGPVAGGLVGTMQNDGSLEIRNSFAAVVVNGSVYGGGLAGKVTVGGAALTVEKSWSDSYVKAAYAGGLAGFLDASDQASASITSSYAAGYLYGSTRQAGLVCTSITEGSLALSCSHVYTVTEPSGSGASDATAKNITNAASTYYRVPGTATNAGNEFVSTDYNVAQFAARLGRDFQTDIAGATPYNLLDQGLGNTYDYPEVVGFVHYGDWVTKPVHAAYVGYYEIYSDGTVGFYPVYDFETNKAPWVQTGSNRYTNNRSQFDGLSTLRNDKVVVGDGYGMAVHKNDNYYYYVHDYINNSGSGTAYEFHGRTEKMGDTVVTDQPGTVYVSGDGYNFFPFPVSWTDRQENIFYQILGVKLCETMPQRESDKKASHYLFSNMRTAESGVLKSDSSSVPSRTVSVIENEVILRTARQLYDMQKYYPYSGSNNALSGNPTFRQDRDIDYATYNWSSYSLSGSVSSQSPIRNSSGNFTSNFDGGGYEIANLNLVAGSGNTGLFGNLTDSRTIKNVNLISTDGTTHTVSVAGGNAGGIAASVGRSSTISGCSVTGYDFTGGQTSSVIGGMAGYNQGTIKDCTVGKCSMDITAANIAGGILGKNEMTTYLVVTYYGLVENCAAQMDSIVVNSLNASSSGLIDGYGAVGCLLGFNDANVNNCAASFNYMSVQRSSGTCDVGGFTGRNDGTINRSYAVGLMDSNIDAYRVGGFIGFNSSNNVVAAKCNNCYSAVTGTAKPFIDRNNGTTNGCYCLADNSASFNFNGTSGYTMPNSGITGATARNFTNLISSVNGSNGFAIPEAGNTYYAPYAGDYQLPAIVQIDGTVVHLGEWPVPAGLQIMTNMFAAAPPEPEEEPEEFFEEPEPEYEPESWYEEEPKYYTIEYVVDNFYYENRANGEYSQDAVVGEDVTLYDGSDFWLSNSSRTVLRWYTMNQGGIPMDYYDAGDTVASLTGNEGDVIVLYAQFG